MSYPVKIESISRDIPLEVRKSILKEVETYTFPNVGCFRNKDRLREIFKRYFKRPTSLRYLKRQLYSLAIREGIPKLGIASIGWTEINKLHTLGLGRLLLERGIFECQATHTKGYTPTSYLCRRQLENKTLNVITILNNTLPGSGYLRENTRIPQHYNCRHIMAPLNKDLKKLDFHYRK